MVPEAKWVTVQGRVQSGEKLCKQCCIKMTDLNVLLTGPPGSGAHLSLLLPGRIVCHVHIAYYQTIVALLQFISETISSDTPPLTTLMSP